MLYYNISYYVHTEVHLAIRKFYHVLAPPNKVFNGKFSTFQICFCGLESGNVKFETDTQRICFWDLRRSILNFVI